MTQPQRRVPPLKPVAGYRRSMKNWYMHSPAVYRWYMVREFSCVGVWYYAAVLICAMFRLGAGEAAFNQFMADMRAPGWLILNLIMLALMLLHSVSWFQVMPKTMPLLFSGGKRVPDSAIVNGGMAAFAAASAAVLIAFWVIKP
jgi:fumarate reductase subunit C